jgi:hypothetical protein
VAFAKRGGVARLIDPIAKLRARGGSVEVMVGFDSRGTSQEAVLLLKEIVDDLYLVHEPSKACSFHPKFYLFDGPDMRRAVVGSQNLTVGGLELNYEAGVILDFDLEADQQAWESFDQAWMDLLPERHPNTIRVDATILSVLVESGELPPERMMRSRSTDVPPREGHYSFFLGLPIAPPTPLEHRHYRLRGRKRHVAPAPVPASQADTLLIEVVPHKNAEVLFSKRALDQNPEFFEWPWSGRTHPKSGQNVGYPQMEPSPSIRVRVFDEIETVSFDSVTEPLTVLYERKSEVRITLGQAVVRHVPPYSLVVMRRPGADVSEKIDYEMDIFPEGSPSYDRLIAACDQTLPSGGGSRARRMGWL